MEVRSRATLGGQQAQVYHWGRWGRSWRWVAASPEMPGTTSRGFT